MLAIIEKTSAPPIKLKTLEIINELMSSIDQGTMKETLLKSLEKVRMNEADP